MGEGKESCTSGTSGTTPALGTNGFPATSAIYRGPTEDIIHYFTLMSSELHYLDIIPKIENLH